MNQKIKNIIIFTSIALVMIIVYAVLIKKKEEPALVSSLPPTVREQSGTANPSVIGEDSERAQRLLASLLSVQNIKLDESIFTDLAFLSLRDSNVILVPTGTEGRPNPFAPLDSDIGIGAGAGPASPILAPSVTPPPPAVPPTAPAPPATSPPAIPVTPPPATPPTN